MSEFNERRAFNFYSSYYEVAKELPEQDRAEFVWSIIHAQFTGELIEPKSTLARLMWKGQLHSIKKQLTGFQYGKATPPKGALEGPHKGPLPQEQVQEKEQVQEESKVDVSKFLNWFNNSKERHTGKKGKFKTLTKTDKNNLKQLRKNHEIDDFSKAFTMMLKSEWVKTTGNATPAHFLRVDNFNRYLNQYTEEPTDTQRAINQINLL